MLVGLNGASRSGKDSVAAVLVEYYGFEQRALASGIRQILLDLNPWLRDNFGDLVQLKWLYEECDGDWDKIKAASRDSVEFMIRLGQSARDVIGEDVWVQSQFPGMQHDSQKNIVVSDCRQPNEVEFIRSFGGELWHIERLETQLRGMDDLLKGVEFDAEIQNFGTLEDLKNTVCLIMEGSQ